jgi:hypothetical protein
VVTTLEPLTYPLRVVPDLAIAIYCHVAVTNEPAGNDNLAVDASQKSAAPVEYIMNKYSPVVDDPWDNNRAFVGNVIE